MKKQRPEFVNQTESRQEVVSKVIYNCKARGNLFEANYLPNAGLSWSQESWLFVRN